VVNPLTAVYWAALVLGREASAAALAPARAGAFVAAVFCRPRELAAGPGQRRGADRRVAGRRRGMLAISVASSLLIAGIAFHILSR
jgi:hypothetical protein